MVVITGASSGLGEALAHSFYRAGCKVVLAARREEELERVRTDLLETHSVNRIAYNFVKITNGFVHFIASSHAPASCDAAGLVRSKLTSR